MVRFIFSIQMTLVSTCGGEVRELIASLNRDGQSRHCRAVTPKRRVIDLRIGDRVLFGGQRYGISEIKAFRDTHGPPLLTTEIAHGYVYRR
jgi:hypothetical protein